MAETKAGPSNEFDPPAPTAGELEQSVAHAHAVLATAVDAIIVIDGRGIVESFNHAAEHMFGYSADEVIGRNIGLLMPEPYRREHDGYLQRYQETGQRHIIGVGREVIALRKDGTTIPVDLAVSELAWEGQQYFVGMLRDLTERKRLEREILTISEDEQQRIGRDLHDDLGQQLTGIAFMSKVLQRSLAKRDMPEEADAQKITNLVEQAIRHTRRLIRGLSPIDMDGLSLLDALQRFVDDTRETFDIACRLEWTQDVTINDPDVKTHLYRIVQEATHNAIRHGKAEHIAIRVESSEQRVTLSVIDDGRGLPDDYKDTQGVGLRNMGHRARILGADLSISPVPEPGRGVVVTCTFDPRIAEHG